MHSIVFLGVSELEHENASLRQSGPSLEGPGSVACPHFGKIDWTNTLIYHARRSVMIGGGPCRSKERSGFERMGGPRGTAGGERALEHRARAHERGLARGR